MQTQLFFILLIIGTIAFAISGALAGIKHKMDLSGVIVLAFVVGNGGGTIRDIMLAKRIFWFTDTIYIWITILAAVVCFLVASTHQFENRIKSLNKYLLLFDAIGLGVFAIAGTEKALGAGTSTLIAIIMGVMTAVGGGVVRDILCSDIPFVFQRELYATLALLGSGLYVVLLHYINPTLAGCVSIVFIVVFRCLALLKNWHLPIAK